MKWIQSREKMDYIKSREKDYRRYPPGEGGRPHHGIFFKEAPGHGWDGQREKSQHKESKGKDGMGN